MCAQCLVFEVEMLVVPEVSYDFIAEAYSSGVSLELEGAQGEPLLPVNCTRFTMLSGSRAPYYAQMLH